MFDPLAKPTTRLRLLHPDQKRGSAEHGYYGGNACTLHEQDAGVGR